ncbi:unnamed protein product [Bursaphelenchus xylophilus]|nr:unnamed protein product [Bursaphelenchus xylophilus]CAG9118715.1 unnamed protein product [Bursaphelenchus xylophilus]
MKVLLILLLVPALALADDLAAAKKTFTTLVTDDLTDAFVTKALVSIYNSSREKLNFKAAANAVIDAVEDDVVSQSKFYSPALAFYNHVSNMKTFEKEFIAAATPSLGGAYRKLLKRAPKTQLAYSKAVKQLITKKVGKQLLTNVKKALSANDWKYLVNDFYSVVKFGQYGISKVA